MKNNYDVLIPQSRKNLHWESEKAEALFKKFVNERASRIVEIADLNFTEKVCQFLTALVGDPPIPEDEFDRVLIFWKNKLKKLN